MNSNNRFGSETIDDDQFLRHPRSGSGYMLSNQYNQLGHTQPQQPPQPPPSNSSLEQQRQVRCFEEIVVDRKNLICEFFPGLNPEEKRSRG